MSLAAEARAQLRRRPFLHAALRAGVLNYAAAARLLDVGEVEPVTAALRRYAEELPDCDPRSSSARVSMRSGLGLVGTDVESDGESDGGDPLEDRDVLLSVGDTALVLDAGSLTAVLATGDVDAAALTHALARLDIEGIAVVAAGVADGTLLTVVERRDGPDAVRIVEDALEAVPDPIAEPSTD